MNGVRDLLQRSPVHKDSLLTLSGELAKLVLLHPEANFLERIHGETPSNMLVVAYRTGVELSQADLIDSTALGKRAY